MLKSELKKQVTLTVQRLVAQKTKYAPSQINLNWVVDKDLDIDSIDIIEIEMEIEDTYDISFSDDDINKFNTIQELIDLIVEKIWDKHQK